MPVENRILNTELKLMVTVSAAGCQTHWGQISSSSSPPYMVHLRSWNAPLFVLSQLPHTFSQHATITYFHNITFRTLLYCGYIAVIVGSGGGVLFISFYLHIGFLLERWCARPRKESILSMMASLAAPPVLSIGTHNCWRQKANHHSTQIGNQCSYFNALSMSPEKSGWKI